MNWEVVNDNDQAKIKVIGVGGAGGNAVIHMMNHKIQGVEFICANTDSQALKNAKGATILKLGGGMTKGLVLEQTLKSEDKLQREIEKQLNNYSMAQI